jgi:intracellular sulfur oxidation DsrE/DsrF family protein
MTENYFKSLLRRRLFLRRMSGVVTVLGGALALGPPEVKAQSGGGDSWKPARHSEDDWMDAVPGVHRFLFDNTTYAGFGGAMRFANNFMRVNRDAYGLEDNDLAVIIVARHFSTPFAFNDAMWERYGVPLAARENIIDPKTDAPPTVNLLNTSGYGDELPTRGLMLKSLLDKGVRLAVCEVAARGAAGRVARAVGGDADSIFEEFTRNLVDNAHLVPAGIVAVNRAQERGYTFSFVDFA